MKTARRSALRTFAHAQEDWPHWTRASARRRGVGIRHASRAVVIAPRLRAPFALIASLCRKEAYDAADGCLHPVKRKPARPSTREIARSSATRAAAQARSA